MSQTASVLLTENDYVEFELSSSDRHEYVDGTTRAMSGASIRHNDVALNLAVALRAAARGSDCKVNIEGVRLRVNSRRHYYPDVMVTCEAAGDTHMHTAPCLVAEVLSPTTESIDRGEKRLAYMAMPSLRHLLLIDLVNETIEHVWRVNEGDPWFFEIGSPGTQLHLSCPSTTTLDVNHVFA
jgi:Uma2 family endonuclease